jgi:hypothetical protein
LPEFSSHHPRHDKLNDSIHLIFPVHAETLKPFGEVLSGNQDGFGVQTKMRKGVLGVLEGIA